MSDDNDTMASVASQYRTASGIPDVDTHVDEVGPADLTIANEPEGGYGGDPDRGATMGLGHQSTDFSKEPEQFELNGEDEQGSEVELTDEEKDGLTEEEQADLLALKRDEAETGDDQ